MKIILASGSPRRRELLQNMGISFEIDVSDVDETASGTPAKRVATLAERKARAVGMRHSSGLILGADTLVALDGRVMGKPVDDADAARMLHSLSGRTHHVLTGVCLYNAANGESKVAVESTGVRFRELTDKEIYDYVATGEPRDKAGAYAIQGGAASFVVEYDGSYSNVVGLPVERLQQMLREMGE